jgi:hypothetical protein
MAEGEEADFLHVMPRSVLDQSYAANRSGVNGKLRLVNEGFNTVSAAAAHRLRTGPAHSSAGKPEEMKMRKSIQIVLVLIAGIALPGVEAASAMQIHQFKGTRDQVRNACTGPNRELTEQGTVTACVDTVKGTNVACGDDGKCAGTTPRVKIFAIGLPGSVAQQIAN